MRAPHRRRAPATPPYDPCGDPFPGERRWGRKLGGPVARADGEHQAGAPATARSRGAGGGRGTEERPELFREEEEEGARRCRGGCARGARVAGGGRVRAVLPRDGGGAQRHVPAGPQRRGNRPMRRPVPPASGGGAGSLAGPWRAQKASIKQGAPAIARSRGAGKDEEPRKGRSFPRGGGGGSASLSRRLCLRRSRGRRRPCSSGAPSRWRRRSTPCTRQGRNGEAIGPLEIQIVRADTFEEVMDYAISRGASINQYKAPRCISFGPILGGAA
ncbi:hypothetical protein GUJ93_ZPchr0010g8226 [Zizania palustris]|uniref:GH3 C-terminal domain-containing protein n=1 Tax=Zizania palustris TaxID=103762 RepID=A0A8J5WBW3_ZIZPA|nr:hypothetical protein GUJ93_ZPchr0010g8226 [Zizania palustris]